MMIELAPLVARIRDAENEQTQAWLLMLICEDRLRVERHRYNMALNAGLPLDRAEHNEKLLAIEETWQAAHQAWSEAKDRAAECVCQFDELVAL